VGNVTVAFGVTHVVTVSACATPAYQGEQGDCEER